VKDETIKVAALFVQRGGSYFSIPWVDPWDETRDARRYAGPHPVVAHPPCSRWCRLAGLVEARWGHRRGEDEGCFSAALSAVRRFGGVLEHPAYSKAWTDFDLPVPPRHGGWIKGLCGGWSCHLEQGRLGHRAKKATWLYCHGCAPPIGLPWGATPDSTASHMVSWCRNRSDDPRPRLGKIEASRTPEAMRDLLLGIALSVPGKRVQP